METTGTVSLYHIHGGKSTVLLRETLFLLAAELLFRGVDLRLHFLSDLLFVESDNHYLTLHTAAGTETFKKNLSEFREELSAAWQASGRTEECFAAAHRSYLVNLAHVERITRTECLLSDGTKIPVSRGCYASLNHAFLQFYRPNAF